MRSTALDLISGWIAGAIHYSQGVLESTEARFEA